MKNSVTIKAAWICFWGMIIAALITALVMIFTKYDSTSKTTHETSLPTESTEFKPDQEIAKDKPTVKAITQGDKIIQKTEGPNSPAIVSGSGDVNITITNKEKK